MFLGAVLQENVQEEDHQAHQGEVWHLVFGGLRRFQNWIRGNGWVFLVFRRKFMAFFPPFFCKNYGFEQKSTGNYWKNYGEIWFPVDFEFH